MRSKALIAGFFAAVALAAAASIYVSATTEKAKKTITALTAPDGKFKAVTITIAEGGAKPFCVAGVSVLLAAYPDDAAERQRDYEVYAAPCGQFADGTASPKLEWLSPAALQITQAVAPGAKPARNKDIDVTKTVRVTVVER